MQTTAIELELDCDPAQKLNINWSLCDQQPQSLFDCLISNFGAFTLSDVAIFADQPKYSPFDDDGGDGDDDSGDGDD